MTVDSELSEFLKDKNPLEWPEFSSITIDGSNVELGLTIYPEIRWFTGHFVDQPVLPGVAQVNWALALTRNFFSECSQFASMENLKFKRMVLPEEVVTLKLQYLPEKKLVKFAYMAEDGERSSGNLRFK